MKRREFITLLGGAVAWPLAAGAQQRERMRYIGMLLSGTADDTAFQAWVGAFLQAMAQSGWIIGRNVRIDIRWAVAKADDNRSHAQEFAALVPDGHPGAWRRRFALLRSRRGRHLVSRRHLCQSHSARREARRSPGAVSDKIRDGREPKGRHGARS